MGVKRPLSGSVAPMRISFGASAAFPVPPHNRSSNPTKNAIPCVRRVQCVVQVPTMFLLFSPKFPRGAAPVFHVAAMHWSRKVHCVQELIISQQTSEVHEASALLFALYWPTMAGNGVAPILGYLQMHAWSEVRRCSV